MQKFINCLKICRDYWRTPKGRHDIIDYSRCILLFAAISLMLTLIIRHFSTQ